jgi:hypothetical protein
MSPRKDVYQAIPYDVSCEANKPLITAASAEEEDVEEQDRRLDKKLFARSKFSALLFGLLLGFLVQLMIIVTKLLLLTFWDEHHATNKSQTIIVVFSLFWSFFAVATIIASLRFLRKLVTSTYSAAGGCSEDLLENMVLHVKCCFGVGTFLAWTIGNIAGVIWGMPTECALLMLAVVPVSRILVVDFSASVGLE